MLCKSQNVLWAKRDLHNLCDTAHKNRSIFLTHYLRIATSLALALICEGAHSRPSTDEEGSDALRRTGVYPCTLERTFGERPSRLARSLGKAGRSRRAK